MMFSKNILVVLLVLSTVSLCLAKPKWIWKDEEEDENDGNDEVMTRETQKNDENLLKKWMESYKLSCEKRPTGNCYGRK